MHSVPALRRYNPIGAVHGGYTAILLDSAMGLAVHTMCPQGSGYTTLEFKVSFIKAMTETTGIVRTEGRRLSFGRRAAPRGTHRRFARAPAGARHHDLPGVRAAQG